MTRSGQFQGMAPRDDWLLKGDVATLQGYLEELETRLYTLERRGVGVHTGAAATCLGILAERYTVLMHFKEEVPAETRAFAIDQVRRCAAAICKQFDMEPPRWINADSAGQ